MLTRRQVVAGFIATAAGLLVPEPPRIFYSIPRTVAPRGRYVNVMDYGALGDGVADDTAAWKRAIQACRPQDILYAPSRPNGGMYRVKGPITIHSGYNITDVWISTTDETVLTVDTAWGAATG